MPFISDAASAIKSRFGFQDRSSELVQSSPAFLKSATKDILVLSSAIRSTRNSDDNDVGACSNNVSSGNSFEFHEDPSFWKDNNVQVIIRIRPLSSTEISLQGHGRCVRPENTQTITWMGHPESRFTFDVVADENVSQESLFKVAGLPMVENCVAGYNSCMFAYGQTGSGKTYTMLGDIEGGTRRHSVNCGMTPRVFEHMFSRIQKEREAHRDEKLKFVCKCSFLEIYNEQILDLLDPSSNNLQIREDTKKGVYVENLKEIEVTSARDVMQQLIQGAANRKVAATNMNRASSRSHSVFTCIIESEWESQGLTHKRFARLNLVDLAGSERQKSSGAEGERLKEATNINKSLSTLGLVIMNLVNISNGKSVHVPYRDSKLTFLLQDSLGGNAKTIIIANISPSSCCSLETLSTLKFAQRAKFIKNNAIINEDTSGDVITMKLQIQQLKKEVSRLRGLVGGGPESQDNEMTLAVSCPGSPGTPGSLKLEGLGGAISPLASAKRVSHKRDYEVALVGAFRREKDKDITLQALTVENKAAVKLAKQREDEIQGLKMRLRFREAAIKRLEAVASGKISAEVHLLKEKEEHLKEIEVLQAQVDRNQEVTRFAMENLRLKEEIRRLKSFYEEGEREHMNEQILVLEGKLLEALDWKFMHESDPSNIQKTNTDIRVEEVHGDDNLLICNKEPVLPWQPSVNEENELLRMQAIHNQAEMDELRKKLEVCLEEKEKLERQDSGSMRKRDDERDSKATKEGKQQVEIPSHSTDLPTNYNDQTELKTMVDVIAAASQREAEAHETAIILSKENDELRMKLKVLIDDNNKLIELYERAILESNYKNTGEALKFCDDTLIHNHGCLGKLNKEEVETSKAVDNLEHQLAEMHEENEKLMGLYERAMTERDELKRMLSAGHKGYERLGDSDCIGLVEVDGSENMTKSSLSMDVQDGGINNDSGKPIPCRELNDSIEYSSFPAYNNRQDVLSVKSNNAATCNEDIMHGGASLAPVDLQSHSGDLDGTLLNMETVPSNLLVVKLSEVMNQVRKKLERADEQLSESAKALALFCMLEKKIIELDKFSSEVQSVKDGIQSKQEHYDSLKTYYSEVKEKKALTDKQLLALKYSLSNFSSSVAYFQERETRAEARLNVSTSYVSQKKEELACQLEEKNKIEAARRRIQQSESELTKHLSQLKLKLEEENHKQEDEKVLFAIDNIEKITSLQKTWQVGGKATELLKSEEEKTKLQAEIKLSRERIGVMRTEIKDLNGKILRLDSKTQAIEVEIQKGKRSVGEMELAFQAVIEEKNTLLELIENGNSEIGIMIVEYLHLVFQADLKNEEMKVLEKELLLELRRVKELGDAKATANEEMIQLLDTSCRYPSFISEKLEDEIHSVRRYILEANSLLIETVY